MEKEQIFAKDLPSEQREAAAISLQKRRELFLRPFKGEYKKDEEDIRFISVINWYITERFRALNINGRPPILSPNQVHFLPEKVYAEFFPRKAAKKAVGFFHIKAESIIIDKDSKQANDNREDKLRLYMTLMHEAIHAVSAKKIFITGKGARQTKIGYQIGKPFYGRQRFVGLNEVITDIVARGFFQNHKKYIEKEFNIKYPEGLLWANYIPYREVWNIIANKISEKTGETRSQLFKRYERGLYTGEMMHLREIERIFGPSTLRIIAALGCSAGETGTEQKSQARRTLDRMVLDYFESKDEREREKLADEVLKISGQRK